MIFLVPNAKWKFSYLDIDWFLVCQIQSGIYIYMYRYICVCIYIYVYTEKV